MYEYFHLISDWILKKNETRLKCFPISMSVNANNIIIRGNVYSFTSVVTNIIFIIILGTPTKSWVSIRNAADQNHSGTAGVFFRQARGKVWPTATVLEFTEPSTAATAAPQATTGVHSRCWCQAVFNGIPIYGISLFQTSSIRPWRFSSPSSDSIISGSGQISGRCLPDGQRNARYDKTHAFGLGCIVFDLIFF